MLPIRELHKGKSYMEHAIEVSNANNNNNNTKDHHSAPRNIRESRETQLRNQQRQSDITKRQLNKKDHHFFSLAGNGTDESATAFNTTGETVSIVQEAKLPVGRKETSVNKGGRFTSAYGGNYGTPEEPELEDEVVVSGSKANPPGGGRVEGSSLTSDRLKDARHQQANGKTPLATSANNESNKRYFGRDPRDCYGHENQARENWETGLTQGTIREAQYMNAEADAETLLKAMRGITTDEQTIIDLTCRRSLYQRLMILNSFNSTNNKNLVKYFKNQLGGHFQEMMLKMYCQKSELDMMELTRAMKGFGTNDSIIDEIMITRSNRELNSLNQIYASLAIDLRKEFVKETNGNYCKYLTKLLEGRRNENHYTDRDQAMSDAQKLYMAGEKKWGTDVATFIDLFSGISFEHMRAVMSAYASLSKKKTLREAIKHEFSGRTKHSLLTTLEIAENMPKYFARKIKDTMKGLIFTAHGDLIRLVITRSEIDMVEIKLEYEKEYKTSMEQDIKSVTSGDYRKLMLACIADRIM